MNKSVEELTKQRRRSEAEIEQHCNALRQVADQLEGEGLYAARLVRASAEGVQESMLRLADVGFKLARKLEDDGEVGS